MRTGRREGGAFRSPRLSVSTLGMGGGGWGGGDCSPGPFPAPTAENQRGRDSLWEDYSLIPSRSHPRLQKAVRGREERRDPGPHPPGLSPAALQEALQEAEWLPSARHAPLPWLQPFSSHDPGGGRAPFSGRGGPWQSDYSFLKSMVAPFFTQPFPGARRQDGGLGRGHWWEAGSAALGSPLLGREGAPRGHRCASGGTSPGC